MRRFDLPTTGDTASVTSRVATIPNAVSLARILALPVIYLDLVTGRLWRGLVLLAIFSATDWVDGYLARRLRQVSRVGQLLDPIADRLLLATVGVGAIVSGLLPWWAVAVVLVRDAAVLTVGATMLARGVDPPPVSRLGKVATFALMAALVLLLGAAAVGGGVATPQPALNLVGWVVYGVGVVGYWLAALDYARIVARRRAPTSGDPNSGGPAI